MMERLVLGTVQLGVSYGIANKTGQPNLESATAIIKEAWNNGIREFDTAQGYGSSEEVVGAAISRLGIQKKVKIISKFHPELDHLNANSLEKSLNQSLQKTGIERLYGMMLHREHFLADWDNGLSEILLRFVAEGKVKHIGVSIESPEKGRRAVNCRGISMIQLPSNMLDRRFAKTGFFEIAAEKGIKTYIRSAFLQGLLLMDINDVPEHMSLARPMLERVDSIGRKLDLSRQEMALGYLKMARKESMILMGAELPEHVSQNVKVWQKAVSDQLLPLVDSSFEEIDDVVLNPSKWPVKKET